MGGHAQQERHVARALAVGGVGRQGVRHLGRRRGGLLGGGATRGAVSGRHLDVDARQIAGEKPVLPGGVVVEVHEAAHGAARRLAVAGAAGAHALHEGEHVAVAAVVGVKPDAVGLPHRPALAAKDADVGAAEAVDGLLGVTDGAEVARPLAGQKADELELDLVGVLELVDHHQAEAPLEGRRHAGVVPHGGKGHSDQVVVVEAALLGLELAIARVHAAGELEEPWRGLGRFGEGRLGACQSEGRLGLRELLGYGLARAGRRHRSQGLAGGSGGLRAGGQGVEGAQGLQGGAHRGNRGGAELLGPKLLEAHEEVMHELGQPHAGGLGREGRKAAGKGTSGVQDGAHLPHGARVAALGAVGAQVLALPDAGEGGVPAGLGHDVLHGLGHKRLLVGVHHHGEVRVKAQVKGIAVQDARAHAVDGHDPGVVHGKGRLGHAGAAQR